MLGHDHIAHNHEAVTLAGGFEHHQEQIAPPRARQPRLPMITTAGDEMQIVPAVIAAGMVRHEASLFPAAKKSCDIRPRRSHLYKERKGGPATLRFPLEASQSLRVPGEIIGQKLQSHKAMERQILSLVDNAHASAAQLFDDAVVRDGLPDQ